MLTLSLSRHGFTEGNLRRAYIGTTDLPLCDEGRESLRLLKADYPSVDQVFVSPLCRCVETAHILYPQHVPHPISGLQERNFGEFENLSHEEIIAIPGYHQWGMTEEGMVFPQGEEREPFFQRCSDAFWDVAQQAKSMECERVAIVTHGGVIMAIMRDYCVPGKSYYQWGIPAGGGYLVQCEVDRRRLTLIRRLGS